MFLINLFFVACTLILSEIYY